MNHPEDQIIGDKKRSFQTRRRVVEDHEEIYLISKIELKLVSEACNDEN